MKTSLLSMMMLAGSLAAAGCGGDDAAAPDATEPDAAEPDAAATPPDAGEQPACNPAPLRADLSWYGENRAALQAFIDANGCAAAGYDATHRPVALFDWDNTTIKNDVGDAFTFWLIKNAKIKQPPDQDWSATSPLMTAEAAVALSAACGTEVPAGDPLPTDTNLACADEILSVYVDGATSAGQAAFAGWNYRRIEPTYAWTAQLAGGYTPEQARGFAEAAIFQHLYGDQGTTQTVGTTTQNGWIRIYEQTHDLIGAMQSSGFDVWIVSASPQVVVEPFAAMVGVAADHVIGIRQLVGGDGRLTYDFEGCGPVADGDDTLIPYIEGKRCWINKVVYGDTSAAAIDARGAGQRQAFAAGDSDTDVEFLRDATQKLVLNRNKAELMCNAYNNAGDSWLINPMFIEPKAMKSSPYACSTSACKDEDGVAGPCVDELGNPIPDQTDIVF